MQMLFVSASYQNFPNGAVSNQLTDVGRRVCWVTINLCYGKRRVHGIKKIIWNGHGYRQSH